MSDPPAIPAVDTPSETWTDETFLLRLAAMRDLFCPSCRYNLRGVTHSNCPECGSALKVRVVLLHAYIKAWITLVAATCIGAGAGVFLGLVALNGDGVDGELLSFAAALAALQVPASMIALAKRRRFMKLKRTVQWVFALLASLVSIAIVVLFAMCVN